MKLAFCLFNYFPFGGLQRDFLRIAKECVRRQHEVDVYTMKWEGDVDPALTLNLIKTSGWQNHTRRQSFIQQVLKIVAEKKYDRVIGFNKMPGLDIYFAADTCYQAKARKQHGAWYRLTPRYRHAVAQEKMIFSPDAHAEILILSAMQEADFFQYYQTPKKRFHLLPPGIGRDRIAPNNAEEIRLALRNEYKIKQDDFLLLMVGSGFKTKGLDRIINAYANLPDEIKKRSVVFVIGKDNPKIFQQQAKNLGVQSHIKFLGGRHDISRFFLAADILLHPAYNESAGAVLLEALVSGLPVITTDICGYAHYVQEANAGRVLSSPFQQIDLNNALRETLLSSQREIWHKNALNFSKQADVFSLPERAVDIIESLPPVFSFDGYMNFRGEVYRELEGRCTQRIQINKKNYFIKQHFGVGWKEIFKNIFQGRLPIVSAKNEWKAIQKLELLGVNTLHLVDYGCRGKNPAKLQSFLLTEELLDSISLEDLCRNWKTQPPDFLFKQALIKQVAKIARILHENGVNHRDFYICHFLLVKNNLYIIDLHRAQIRRQVPERWRIKDLAGLYFSSKDIGLTQRDLLRFMREYRKQSLRVIFKKEFIFWEKVRQRGEKLYQACIG